MAAQARTHSKLRFARVILDDLRDRPGNAGDDFQRAREEAFLFHLHGARDAFLLEVNEHHKCGLPLNRVKVLTIRKWFDDQCRPLNPQVQEIVDAEAEAGTTLHLLKEWRDNSTHRGGIRRLFIMGGEKHGQRHLENPATKAPSERDALDDFEAMLVEVKSTIERLRADLALTTP